MSLNDDVLKVKEEKNDDEKSKKDIKKKRIYYIVLGFCLAIVVALFSLTFYISSNLQYGYFSDISMAPTINKRVTNEGIAYEYNNFKNADGNIVEYGLVDPYFKEENIKRFDIIVLATAAAKSNFAFTASRVVGLPGETVKIDYHGDLYINGEKVNQPIDKEYLKINWDNYSSRVDEALCFIETLADNEYYLLKDNRYYTNAGDSRRNGPYTFKDFYGKVVAITGTCTISDGKCINRTIPFPRFI